MKLTVSKKNRVDNVHPTESSHAKISFEFDSKKLHFGVVRVFIFIRIIALLIVLQFIKHLFGDESLCMLQLCLGV